MVPHEQLGFAAGSKWPSAVTLCVFMLCVTALVLGLVAILHG